MTRDQATDRERVGYEADCVNTGLSQIGSSIVERSHFDLFGCRFNQQRRYGVVDLDLSIDERRIDFVFFVNSSLTRTPGMSRSRKRKLQAVGSMPLCAGSGAGPHRAAPPASLYDHPKGRAPTPPKPTAS
jgi:hypothetical protein